MNLTKCPDCQRLSFVKVESCPGCNRAFRPGELQAQANREESSFGRKYNGLFAALFLIALAALAFVMLRGT